MAVAGASMDEYLKYKRIVGSDDGGKLMTEDEYKDYIKTKVPQRIANRLFVNWTNSEGLECKAVGPETMCFCMHRYKEHQTDLKTVPEARPIHIKCNIRGCKCKSFLYIPFSGGGPIRCTCKHSADVHEPGAKKMCKKKVDCGCQQFKSSYTCDCTQAYSNHSMVVETKQERMDRGKSTGADVGYAAMGGITGFSSLMDGYLRLDGSGPQGAMSKEELDRPIQQDDHPFLRMHAPAIHKYEKIKKKKAIAEK